jgi:hypothetical protein
MINNSNVFCKIKNCKEKAFWGKDFVMLHCETHKNDDDYNYAEQDCAKCGLSYILDSDNHCENCTLGQFERVALAKQKAVIAFLAKKGLVPSLVDRIVDNGICGRERPDALFEREDGVLIVEIDEYKHRDRVIACERARMFNLGQSFGGTPVIFLRFNPDEYKSDKKLETIVNRHEVLAQLVQLFIDGELDYPKDALCSAMYLYYDKWEGIEKAEWEILTKFENEATVVGKEPIYIQKTDL